MKNRDGYMVVEAVYLLPAASVLILFLVYLCSYLYQNCYLVQSAYVAAFRAARQENCSEVLVNEELDSLLEDQALTFGEEKRQISVNLLGVSVALERDTPLPEIGEKRITAQASWWIPVRDPAAYIRGLQTGKELMNNNE